MDDQTTRNTSAPPTQGETVTTFPARRAATVEDIVRRLQDSDHERTAVDALGWGMGPAQLNFDTAIRDAEAAGLIKVTVVRRKTMVELVEKPEPKFTVHWDQADGHHMKTWTRSQVEQAGRNLRRFADSGDVWNIAVYARGNGVGGLNDVTFNFDCFC